MNRHKKIAATGGGVAPGGGESLLYAAELGFEKIEIFDYVVL